LLYHIFQMKQILLFGAGRSATDLIDYLATSCIQNSWSLYVCDSDKQLAISKIKNYKNCEYLELDIHNEHSLNKSIADSDLVISLLPPSLHSIVANACLKYKKDLLTASYVDDYMKSLDIKAKEAGVLFLCEMGLDPGIDHMSSMQLFERIDSIGGRITSYLSSTGGLVSPISDDNPWHYKFSWNPKNVINAGKGTAQFLKDGQIHYTPYSRIFNTIIPYHIEYYGEYDSYPNRDSLKYINLYNLKDVSTIYRGTLRKSGFTKAWNALIQMGFTQDNFFIEQLGEISFEELSCRLLEVKSECLKSKMIEYCQNDIVAFDKIEWLGLLSKELIPLEKGTPADVLEYILLNKWSMQPNDKDLIIMLHDVTYILDNDTHNIVSLLTLEGQDAVHTAMSKCVGLPLAIYAEYLLHHGRPFSGVHIPVRKEIYQPVMTKLADLGINFKEIDTRINH
jgi:saccharopine dehydrogenase-like NADP-dependent oxidoreductase